MKWRTAWAALCLWALLPAPPPGWAQSASSRPNRVHNPNVPEALTIVIRPEGFAQKVVRVPRGIYALGVFNRSGLDDLALELDRMPGRTIEGPAAERVSTGVAAKRTARWLRRVTLTPGTHRLRVSNRPAWVCTIEVR